MIVLFDTNMLLVPKQFGIDVFSEVDRLVPGNEKATITQVVHELENVNDRRAANVGLELVKRYALRIIPATGKADDALIDVAIKERAVVCTNDRELKERCAEKGVKIIFMRGKKKLEIR